MKKFRKQRNVLKQYILILYNLLLEFVSVVSANISIDNITLFVE